MLLYLPDRFSYLPDRFSYLPDRFPYLPDRFMAMRRSVAKSGVGALLTGRTAIW